MMKGELARATVTRKQAHFSVVMPGSVQLPHTDSKGDRDVGKEITPLPSSYPTASRGFCLDDVRGPVCTTHKVTILPFRTIIIHGNTGVWGHYMWVHVLPESAWGPQLPTSVVSTATYGELHPGSSWVPICLQNMSACPIEVPAKSIVGKVAPANQGTAGGPPNGDLGRVCHMAPRKNGSWRHWTPRA